MIKAKRDPNYWNTDKPPLLMQGFERQTTNDFAPIQIDRRDFVTKVNRGVVTFLDYQSIYLALLVNGGNEQDFNSSQITCLAGGQEILVNEPAERFDYNVDIGDKKEHKIPVIINGGQTITSTLELPDLTSNSASAPIMLTQLIAYYSTAKHEAFKKQYAKFGSGLGLKRRSYRLAIPNGSAVGTYNIVDTIPKNQGKIIGFSIMYEGNLPSDNFVNFKVDDLGVIENIMACRFSRFNQRDPFIQWMDLNPGSTFELNLFTDQLTISPTNLWVTFYFDN